MPQHTSYSQVVRFRAPDGFGEALAEAAARDLTTSSEFVRRALAERLRSLGIDPNKTNKDGGMTMAQPITQDVRDAIAIGEELVRTRLDVSEMVARFRPAIVDHLRQAHDCLGLVIQHYEQGNGDVPGVVVHGYFSQHNENIKEAEALIRTLAELVIEHLKDDHQ